MNALVLAGGRGTRLDAAVEKPLLEVDGRPMIDRVLDALADARVGAVAVAVSPNAPATRDHVLDRGAVVIDDGDGLDHDTDASPSRRDADDSFQDPDDASPNPDDRDDVALALQDGNHDPALAVVDTPGDGYVEDLDAALGVVGRPAVTVTADLPLLAAEHVADAVAASADGRRSVTVRVPATLKRLLGVTCDQSLHGVAPTGLNVVGPPDAPSATRRSYDARLAVNVNTVGDARVAEALAGPR